MDSLTIDFAGITKLSEQVKGGCSSLSTGQVAIVPCSYLCGAYGVW
jgi:hypothetical protein